MAAAGLFACYPLPNKLECKSIRGVANSNSSRQLVMANSKSDDGALRDVLLSILREGLLRIHALGWSGDADRCAIEADHLHNLPELVSTLKPELLRSYYEIAVPSFMRKAQKTEAFKPYWSHIEAVIERRDRRKWIPLWKEEPREVRK